VYRLVLQKDNGADLRSIRTVSEEVDEIVCKNLPFDIQPCARGWECNIHAHKCIDKCKDQGQGFRLRIGLVTVAEAREKFSWRSY